MSGDIQSEKWNRNGIMADIAADEISEHTDWRKVFDKIADAHNASLDRAVAAAQKETQPQEWRPWIGLKQSNSQQMRDVAYNKPTPTPKQNL